MDILKTLAEALCKDAADRLDVPDSKLPPELKSKIYNLVYGNKQKIIKAAVAGTIGNATGGDLQSMAVYMELRGQTRQMADSYRNTHTVPVYNDDGVAVLGSNAVVNSPDVDPTEVRNQLLKSLRNQMMAGAKKALGVSVLPNEVQADVNRIVMQAGVEMGGTSTREQWQAVYDRAKNSFEGELNSYVKSQPQDPKNLVDVLRWQLISGAATALNDHDGLDPALTSRINGIVMDAAPQLAAAKTSEQQQEIFDAARVRTNGVIRSWLASQDRDEDVIVPPIIVDNEGNSEGGSNGSGGSGGSGGAGDGGGATQAPAPSTNPADYNDYVRKVFKNYIGREPTAAELQRDTGALAGGMSKNDFLITASQSPEAVMRRDRVMTGDRNEFDAVVSQVWKDYFGTAPDPASIRIHGAALKGGMSIEDFREMVETAPSAGMVTDGQKNDQNSMMANSVQVSAKNGTYVPAMPGGTLPPADGGGGSAPAPGATVTPSPQPQDDANTSYVKQVYKNYLGRSPSAAELSRDVGFLNGGGSQNAFLIEATKSADAVAHRNKVMAGDKGEFDAVVVKIFNDYAGVNPDPESIKIHGAALKGGMSIDDFRTNMLTAPVVQSHVASNPVTDGMINDQNSMMANAVQVADTNNTYVPSIDNVMATAVATATAMVDPAPPQPAAPAPAAPASPVPDAVPAQPAAPAAPAPNELSYAQKEQMNSIWFKYTGRNMDEGDLAIHGPALISGSKTMGQLEQEVANSPEALRFMAPNNYDYINKAFKNYLGRDVDRAGLEIWNNNLNSGTTRSQALVSIANSEEGKAYTNKMAYINEHDATVNGIWNKYGINASAHDKVIHGAALKGGMSANDLDGYVAQAVGMPGYTTNP